VLTVYSDDHRRHHGRAELVDGRLLPCFEMPRRADLILEAVRTAGLGPVVPPEDLGRAPIERVHDPRLVRFLESAWGEWSAQGHDWDLLPFTWPVHALRHVEPRRVAGRAGYWCFDAGTPIMAGTWRAVLASAQVALTGAKHLAGGAQAVFALCRPPGHHAHADLDGGYCFLNNAAIAAQFLRDDGAAKVAILDVDYHHGNGTQAIFYRRPDVLFVSLHGDPAEEFPFFLGYTDEIGEGPGEGFNLNLPLPGGTGFDVWTEALTRGLARIAAYRPNALVVSLGVDTFKEDPISHFRLESEDFRIYGRSIAGLKLPTLFVMEGGYAIEPIGLNTANVLKGFLEGR
jgi:acetoin utilization deacetylase AcuC-like enzyme